MNWATTRPTGSFSFAAGSARSSASTVAPSGPNSAGLSEILNTPQGRVYQTPCTAVLGDSILRCRSERSQLFRNWHGRTPSRNRSCSPCRGCRAYYDANWFRRVVGSPLTSGEAAGTGGCGQGRPARPCALHEDRALGEACVAAIAPGDTVRLDAGCDKRASTCREKFANIVNYRGFPDIPGDNKLLSSSASHVSSTANGTSCEMSVPRPLRTRLREARRATAPRWSRRRGPGSARLTCTRRPARGRGRTASAWCAGSGARSSATEPIRIAGLHAGLVGGERSTKRMLDRGGRDLLDAAVTGRTAGVRAM